MSKQDERAQALMDALREPLHKIRQAGNLAVPADDQVADALRGCLSSRDGAWRKTKPDGDGPASVLWTLVKFQRSGGSLYGWPLFADRTLVDQLDTVAQVMLMVSGQELTAVTAWQRALGR